MDTKHRPDVWPIPMLLLMTAGCSSDERLIELSERASARQHAQNETIARQTDRMTELTQEFIEEEAAARQELLELQQQLADADAQNRRELNELQQQAHASISARTQALDGQRDALEAERRQIAAERQRAPVIAEAVKFAAGVIACLLPLGVVVYLLFCLRDGAEADSATVEILVQELVSDQPRLLSRPSSTPALTATKPGEHT